MGGERLGARTHGGHVPPPGATALADGSTVSGGVPLPMPASACERMRGAAASASVERKSEER
jgi:hypothetical protein